MAETGHIEILKRVGAALVVIGMLDIAYMTYTVAQGNSYSSSLNIFAVIAGIFLIRGNLTAAGIISWIALFLFTMIPLFALGIMAMVPFDLVVTQLKLAPAAVLTSAAIVVTGIAVAGWAGRELTRESIMDARREAGMAVRPVYIPLAGGFAVAAIVVVFLFFGFHGQSAAHAKRLAAGELGSAYQYHVSAINISIDGEGKSVYAKVTAWKDGEIKTVPVNWHEQE